MPARGLENQSLNWAWLAKTCGMRKCMSDHSSMRSFCRGVPVMSSRRALLKFSSVCHRWLFQFFIMCASSRIRYFHFLRRKTLASCKGGPVTLRSPSSTAERKRERERCFQVTAAV